MILPTGSVNGRDMAHSVRRGLSALSDSTTARTGGLSAASEYPRSAAVYKLRTPSPGGQCGAKRPILSAFFTREAGYHNPVLREPEQRSGVYLSEREIKGAQSCPSERSFFPLRPARRLQPVVRAWATRQSAVAQSAQVRRLSPATARCRVRPSVPQAISLTASSTRASVTDPSATLKTYSDKPRVSDTCGFFVPETQARTNFSAQSKRDI